MSELIVVDYHDALRAGEVLAALKARHPQWSADLEDAVVFLKHADETMRIVRQRKPTDTQTQGTAPRTAGKTLSTEQWQEQMGLSDEFMLQVRRLIRPGDSALLMLIRDVDPDLVIDAAQQYGGRVLRTSVTSQQDAQFQLGSAAAAWA
ncbi:MAG TPA: DUF1269 domain-containing protein [Ktedonobacterales bacterium]|nr:DUF1269 domain-containing protein [Ktedonobacterales bacterium]